MKARYKGPAGTGIITLPDDATVKAVFEELKARTGIEDFTVKFGPPMAMQNLDISASDTLAKSMGLHGETLTIVPREPQSIFPVRQATEGKHPSNRHEEASARPAQSPEDVTVPWPEREGTVLLRIMPSDNSCLFTAFGGALPTQIPAPRLRRMMADFIAEHPEEYTEAVLGSSPAQYSRSIQDPDRWGGGIELSILSSIFDIEICTFDVQAQNLIKFGENKKDRCILVYSGIHYDRVAFALSEPPYEQTDLPPEMDCTRWSTDDNEILSKTHDLVNKLHNAHYYTDTEGLILRCDVPGCDWIGSGQAAGQQHAQKTGHLELSEVTDTVEDNTLRQCDAPSCTFMGQGDKARSQHTSDTGHKSFSVIPDF